MALLFSQSATTVMGEGRGGWRFDMGGGREGMKSRTLRPGEENGQCGSTPSAKPSNAVSELEESRKPQQASRCSSHPRQALSWPGLARFLHRQRTSNRPTTTD